MLMTPCMDQWRKSARAHKPLVEFLLRQGEEDDMLYNCYGESDEAEASAEVIREQIRVAFRLARGASSFDDGRADEGDEVD